MNTIKKILSLSLLTSLLIYADGNVAPFIAFRSPGRDTARKVVGMSDKHTNLYNMEAFYGTFWIAPSYERSFKPGEITKCLFGTDINENRELRIQGSTIKTDDHAWLSENFILPSNFKS